MCLNQLKMLSTTAALSFGVALAAAPSAEASPRFTVINEIDKTANVYIYTGADSVCSLEEKLKKAVAGETDTYGCTGQGKGQCKIEIFVGGDQICKNRGDTCNNNAMKVKGGSTVSIAKPGDDYVCHID